MLIIHLIFYYIGLQAGKILIMNASQAAQTAFVSSTILLEYDLTS